MPISLDRALRHIHVWTQKLAPYTARADWPRFLFHTCDLSVAVEIIRRGEILSRNLTVDQVGLICDVANQGALWNNPSAHDYVRLYFRPRNSFHLKTEGIKSRSDPYRSDPHMTVPVAFAFSFECVMTMTETRFLAENFALTGSVPIDGDDAFRSLDFDLIYHDSAPSEAMKQKVHRARMAEVIVENRLSLDHCKAIVLRNDYERRSLLYRLSVEGLTTDKAVVEQRGGTFIRKAIMIEEVSVSQGHLIISFCGPSTPKGRQDDYAVRIRHGDFDKIYNLSAGKRWKIPTTATFDQPVRIDIEGCFAFEARVPAGDTTLV